MKKVTLSTRFNASDKFQAGDCATCPIVIKKWDETFYGGKYKYICPLQYSPINCPMEVESEAQE